MVSEIFDSSPLWPGDVCMKDTNHCVYNSRRHRSACVNVKEDKQLTATEQTIWAERGTVLGWSDPTFAHDSVATVTRGVAPAHSSRCAAPNSIAAFA
jgi:hypothetical protein